MRIYVDPHMNTWEPGDHMHIFVLCMHFFPVLLTVMETRRDRSVVQSQITTNLTAFCLKYILTHVDLTEQGQGVSLFHTQ